MKSATIAFLFLFPPLALGQDRLKFEIRNDFTQRDAVSQIAISGDTLLAIGIVSTNSTGGDRVYALQAYSKGTGALLWAVNPAPGNAMAVDDGRVFVSGVAGLSAYSVETGQPLWSQTFSSTAGKVVANINAVVVSGPRAFDPVDGHELWLGSSANPVGLDGFSLYAVGGSGPDRFLRSQDARTGNLNWQTILPATIDARYAVTAPGRVYLAGWSGPNATIAAFESGSGDLLWQNNVPGAFYDVTVKRNKLVGVGTDGSYNALIRTYDAESGQVLWSDLVPHSPYDSQYALVATASDEAAYVAGYYGYEYGQLFLRAYNLDSGIIHFDERTPLAGLAAHVSGIKLDGGELFLGGAVSRMDSSLSFDWVVRAYEVRDIEERAEPVPQGRFVAAPDQDERKRVRR